MRAVNSGGRPLGFGRSTSSDSGSTGDLRVQGISLSIFSPDGRTIIARMGFIQRDGMLAGVLFTKGRHARISPP
jgi:hypothetical protein